MQMTISDLFKWFKSSVKKLKNLCIFRIVIFEADYNKEAEARNASMADDSMVR